MLNKKLSAIALLIEKDDTVIDIGCDHAYLAIYLKKNNLCQDVYASDISINVLKTADNNIKKSSLNIKTYLSDGFNNIKNNKIDTAIISGMGTSTILKIVRNAPHNILKYIISSNNEHYLLRKEMQKLNFYLTNEIVIYENNKYYPIMFFKNSKKKVSIKNLKYGKNDNKDYYCYLLTKEKEILSKIPKKHIILRIKHQKSIRELTHIIKRIPEH